VRLPNSDAAIIPAEKLRGYLLSDSHPIGRYKAAFFRALGFYAESWELLEAALREVLSEDAERIEVTEYGSKYLVKGNLFGPTGRAAGIATVWIILSGETVPRFITAYPED
jgi:hypothetical protein